MYRDNYTVFEKTARFWCKSFAPPSPFDRKLLDQKLIDKIVAMGHNKVVTEFALIQYLCDEKETIKILEQRKE